MTSPDQNGHGRQPPGSNSSGFWPLSNLPTSYTRSALDMAQELLPNLPRRGNSSVAGASRSMSSLPESENSVTVDLSSIMAAEEGQGEPLSLNPQMASRMEEIRSLLQSLNARQQQHQHPHTHSHLSPPDSPPLPDHAHSHAPGGGAESRGEGQGMGELPLEGLRKFLKTSGVFFVLLLLRFLYDHRLGLIVMVAMGGTFYYVNIKLVQCIHHTAVREVGSGKFTSLAYPVWLTAFLGINVSLLYYSFRHQALWNLLMYSMPVVGEVDVWTLLWVVLLTDFVVKFGTVAVKCCVFLLPAACLPHRRRGKYYMFLEKLSQWYRQTVPVLPWVHYLLDDQEIGRWFAIASVIVYLLLKIYLLVFSTKEVIKAVLKLRLQRSFGSKPTAEELKQRGTICPICQEEFKEPILLSCKHIFCENCVSLWFDREKTCPMCRAQITDDPQFQDGSTSASFQWY